jgi:hypothetical protein
MISFGSENGFALLLKKMGLGERERIIKNIGISSGIEDSPGQVILDDTKPKSGHLCRRWE